MLGDEKFLIKSLNFPVKKVAEILLQRYRLSLYLGNSSFVLSGLYYDKSEIIDKEFPLFGCPG